MLPAGRAPAEVNADGCGACGRATASSACRTSAAVGRAAGSLRSSCMTIEENAPAPRAGTWGSADRMACIVACVLERRNGDMPSAAV